MDFPDQLWNQTAAEEFLVYKDVSKLIKAALIISRSSVGEPSMNKEEIKFLAFLPLAKEW